MTPEEPPRMNRLTEEIKVSPSKRVSRRLRGEEPVVETGNLNDDEVANQRMSREMKMLARKGGKGGRPIHDPVAWELFPPKKIGGLTRQERQVSNSTVFNGLCEVMDPVPEDNDDRRNTGNSTHQMINMKDMERLINMNLRCSCSLRTETDDFLTFCSNLNNQMTCEQMIELRKTWHQRRSEKTATIKFNVQNMGLEPMVTMTCSNCNNVFRLPNEYSKYNGISYSGKSTIRENCSWFSTNLRFVLGTLAAGIGATEAATLLSFIGLPNLQSFSRKQYRRIELLLGKYLRETADESMTEMLELEIEQTQQFKQEPIQDWRTIDNPTGLTLSFDMGWSKRSSGNRYDSLSGHAFLLGCHTKKILFAQVTSKNCTTCTAAASKGIKAPKHECPKNYHGSSKAIWKRTPRCHYVLN